MKKLFKELITLSKANFNKDKIPIAGTVSTRSMHSRSLPNFPRVNMLKISDDISMIDEKLYDKILHNLNDTASTGETTKQAIINNLSFSFIGFNSWE